jgi:hypothetical protein
MSTNTPIVGVGVVFEFATVASPTIFTALNGVDSITFSGDKIATEKTTNMASAGGVDTYITSTQEPGSADVKAFWYPADTTQVALEVIRLAGVAVQMKATYGSGNANSRTFSGIVESMSVSHPLDKPSRLDVKIKLSGPWTLV